MSHVTDPSPDHHTTRRPRSFSRSNWVLKRPRAARNCECTDPLRCPLCAPYIPENVRRMEEKLNRIIANFERIAEANRLMDLPYRGRVQ
jgi:hypothetical protein